MANIKGKKVQKSKSNLILGLVGGAIVLAILGLILFFEISPLVIGNGEFSSKLDAMRGKEATMVELTDPTDPTAQKQNLVTSSVKATELMNKLCAVADNCSYNGHAKSPSGHWDVRARFHVGGEEYDFYLTSERMYVAVGNVQYYFAPAKDAQADFSELYSSVLEMMK